MTPAARADSPGSDAAAPPFVTVVTGVPRSGTSLMMQMLRAGGLELLDDSARGPDDGNPRGYFEFEPVKRLRQDSSWLADAVGRAVKVVQPHVTAVPNGLRYRVILMRRATAEVLASTRARLVSLGEPPGDVPEARQAEILEAQEREVVHWAASRPDVELLVLSYPGVVADAGGAARSVSEFLGGGLDTQAMARAVEPRLRRQRS